MWEVSETGDDSIFAHGVRTNIIQSLGFISCDVAYYLPISGSREPLI